MTFLLLGIAGVAVGILGALLGLGGGVFLVPVLTVFFHMGIREVVAASLVAVIATSGVATVRYLQAGMTNVGLAIMLEMATTAGAISGAFLAAVVPASDLDFLFAIVAGYTAVHMVIGREHAESGGEVAAAGDGEPAGGQGLAARVSAVLSGSYKDEKAGAVVRYRPRHLGAGLGAGALAGAISGLLGIGGGPVKVPIMVLLMGLPTRAAAATSNFMVGITAASSAFVYLRGGHIDLPVSAIVAVTVMAGAAIGTRISFVVSGRTLRVLFSLVLLGLAIEMALHGLHGGV